MFDRFLPEDLQAGIELTDAATARRDPMMSLLSRQREPTATCDYMQLYQRFIYDENGERLRALGATLDVTESFQRQAELEALSIRFGIATRAAHAGVWEWQEQTAKSCGGTTRCTRSTAARRRRSCRARPPRSP